MQNPADRIKAYPRLAEEPPGRFRVYITAWLGGSGAVAIYNLMDDVATAEIARSQILAVAVRRQGHHGALAAVSGLTNCSPASCSRIRKPVLSRPFPESRRGDSKAKADGRWRLGLVRQIRFRAAVPRGKGGGRAIAASGGGGGPAVSRLRASVASALVGRATGAPRRASRHPPTPK